MQLDGLRSKSWTEFSWEYAPHSDFVFTVCDNAAGKVCPIWSCHPITFHWSIEDPSGVEGSNQEKLLDIQRSCRYIENRIKLFTTLPFDKLDSLRMKDEIEAIGAIK